MVPAFVINLDRRPGRWRAISENLDRIGVRAQRVSAIDGWMLSSMDDPAFELMGSGHVGCARSHYKAYAAFLASPAPAALILEDDAEVGGSVASLLRSLEWWPEGHGLVHLGSPENIRTRRRCCLARPVGHAPCRRQPRPILRKHLGAFGYLTDRATAGRILDIAPHVPAPIDHLLFDMVDLPVARRARPLQMTPAPIRHRPHALVGSDTQSPRDQELKNWLGRKPWKANKTVRVRHKVRWVWPLLTERARNVCVTYEA